ncbi:MAG: hypothetical protein JWO28_2641 [Hyphomicrobiales bacterium]|nr:hypothetical protein [Hyphomicrobiales bacterium]
MSSVATLPSAKSLAVAALTPRSAASISAEIGRLSADLTAGNARLAELTGAYDAAILAGDAEAQANEAETTATRRGVRRAELLIADLREELVVATRREADEMAQSKRDAANAAVAALLADMDKGYRVPARIIANFMQKYDEVTAQALDAGVPTPHALTRFKAGNVEPAHDRQVEVYIDEAGFETSNAFPPGDYRLDREGRKLDPRSPRLDRLMPERQKRVKTVHVEARRHPDRQLAGLVGMVSLPAATLDDETYWTGASIEAAFESGGRRR